MVRCAAVEAAWEEMAAAAAAAVAVYHRTVLPLWRQRSEPE